MPILFLFTVIAPEGTLRAQVHLEPGRRYGPDDVQVAGGGDRSSPARRLTVRATRLPSEGDFRELAARAATRSANVPADPFLRLLNLLIPF